MSEDHRLSNSSILVVDDVPDLLDMICEVLHVLGAFVFGTRSLNPSTMVLKGGPDLIIMDLMLQGYSNGIEVTKDLRARGYRGPVIGLSASPQMMAMAQAEEGLFVDYISKPFEVSDLLLCVMRHVPHGNVVDLETTQLPDHGDPRSSVQST